MSDLSSLRIGIVAYTNAYPLSDYLPEIFPHAQYVRLVPSELAQLLHRGELDVAVLSSIELLRHPECGYVPGIGICSDGEVKSVCLFTRKELPDIRSVALDQSSLTSITLIKILMKEYWGVQPEYHFFKPPLANGLQQADAAVTIGDTTFAPTPPGVRRIDLGEVWQQWSGLPFVYAVWITRKGFDPQAIQEPFLLAREMGLERIEAVAQRCAGKQGLPFSFYLDYFTRCIHYTLGEREEAGMKRFFQYARPFIEQTHPV